MAKKLGRNARCWCGSGKKYKSCHLAAEECAEAEQHRPPMPRPREIWEVRKSILMPTYIRSDEVGPDGH